MVYENNGVTITSWPAIHSLDGSVSYRLEWSGLSFVFGGDTRPNKWFIKYAQDADFVIHECFPTPEGMAAFNDWELRQATYVTSYIHTPPSTTENYKKAPRSGFAKMSDYVMNGVWDGFTPPPLPKQ